MKLYSLYRLNVLSLGSSPKNITTLSLSSTISSNLKILNLNYFRYVLSLLQQDLRFPYYLDSFIQTPIDKLNHRYEFHHILFYSPHFQYIVKLGIHSQNRVLFFFYHLNHRFQNKFLPLTITLLPFLLLVIIFHFYFLYIY